MDNLNKIVYLGHRRFLLATDELRNDTDNFPHMEEYRSPPSLKTMDYVDECNAKYDATLSATKRKKIAQSSGCKGACALRVLPNFDSLNQVPVEPMHLIKNIAEHIVKLLAGISDTIKVRREEEAHNRFRSTWIVGNSKKLAPAPFSLSKRELNLANTRAKLINVPDSYDWKPRELFTNTGMKSHEWKEIICSGILKFCIRDLLGTNQRQTLYLLCDTVTKIHSPSIKTDIISEIEQNIHSSLALLERDFPVSLNVMVFHLLHHLPLYMRHFGPVFEYWMYPFERFNSWLGSRVTNKRYPESTVVETYRVYEWAVHLQMSGQLPAGSILATDTMALNMKELATTDEAIDDIKLVYLQKYYEVTLPAYAHLCKRYLHEKSKAKNLHQLKNFPSMGNWTPSAPSLSDSEKLLCCGPDRNIKTIKFYNIPYCRGYIKLTTKAIVSLNLLQHIHPIFGQVQLLFEHSFGEVDGVLAYVQWYNTDTLDEETNMFIVSTNIHVNYTCGTKHNPVVNVKDLKGPFVTAHDEIDKNKLWILNYNEVLLNI